jgi:hypothetical protein
MRKPSGHFTQSLARASFSCLVAWSMIAVILAISSCGGGSSSHSETVKLRVVNGFADPLTVTSNGSTLVSNLAVFTGTVFQPMSAGTLNLMTNANAQGVYPVKLLANTQYTALFWGFGPFTNGWYVLPDDTTPAAGSAKLRIVHAALNSPASVDVYVQAPGTTPTGTPFASGLNLSVNDVTSYLAMVPGQYDIYFTASGTHTVFYHVGSTTFASGQNRTVVLLNNYPVNETQYASLTLADLN